MQDQRILKLVDGITEMLPSIPQVLVPITKMQDQRNLQLVKGVSVRVLVVVTMKSNIPVHRLVYRHVYGHV